MREIIAENYLCFLALIEMIIEDIIGKSYIDQFYLAEYFGVVVPAEYKIDVKNIQYSNKDRELGVHLNEAKLNVFFENTGIPLHADYIHVSQYEENKIDDFRYPDLRDNNYIVYTYSYGELYHMPELNNNGHVALLDKVISEDCVRIYDPGPKDYGYKEVSRFNLYEAMRLIKSGIYVFEVHI